MMTREDEDFHAERSNQCKIIRMLRMSAFKKQLLDKVEKHHPHNLHAMASGGATASEHQVIGQVSSKQDVCEQIDQLLESEPSVRFFGSEHWKISSYMSTILPTFFLSALASVVDFAKEDVSYMIQEWLFIV